jgi:hypothetical protein
LRRQSVGRAHAVAATQLHMFLLLVLAERLLQWACPVNGQLV